MNDEQKKSISDTVLNLLEDTAFVFAEPYEGERDVEKGCRGVKIEFSGHKTGTIILCAEESFLGFIAANMLGLDESDDKAVEKGVDAFKEILNIIAGNILTSLYGEEPVFDLEIPEEITDSEKKVAAESSDSLWFDAEGKKLVFLMKESG